MLSRTPLETRAYAGRAHFFNYHRTAALRIAVFIGLILMLLTRNGWQRLPVYELTGQVTGQAVTTNCQPLQIPAVTHGFQKTDSLPNGDHFLLAEPFTLGIVSPSPVNGSIPGLRTFTVTPTSFGGDVISVGGLPGTNPTGFGYSTSNGRLTLLSCTDSIWDGSFFIASKGTTVGDVIRFFVQRPDGSGAFTLFSFTVEANGVRLTEINEHGALYQASRLAESGRFFEGEFLPFVADAGEAGRRTNLLTFSFDMEPNSPLNDCLQLGITLNRGNETGAISLLVTDIIVNRVEVAGDTSRTTPGLIGGITTGYPTGRECQVYCAKCEDGPKITCPAPVSVCATAGSTSANVTYAAPVATGGATVSCSPASGSSFLLGTTTVTCTASSSVGQASCSFTVTVSDAPDITCPANITASATSASGAVVNFTTPTGSGQGTTVTCNRNSGSTFPVGTTTVTCTATNSCGTTSCNFTVTVNQPAKCDTLCYRSAGWWALNLDRAPAGTVVIYGLNNNIGISTYKDGTIYAALQGNPFGTPLTPRQRFNREYVAAQLNILHYGGPGAPTVFNTMWANLSCYDITFPAITLSNGAVLTRDSMVKELYMHITLAIQARNDADLAKLTTVLRLLNGTSLLGVCN
jgi:hypothetical protein